MNQVLIATGWPVLKSIWNNSSEHDFLEFNLFCYKIDRLQLTAVNCNRLGVEAQHLKWHVSLVQKCAQNGYRKKWRSTHTAWQQVGTGNKLQVKIGTKMKLGPKVENSELDMFAWYCMTRTPMTTWPFTLASTLSERSAHCSVSSCVLARHISHTHRGSSHESFTPSTCPCSCERFSSPWFSLSVSLHSVTRSYPLVWCPLRHFRGSD